jgi:hypothetical protein
MDPLQQQEMRNAPVSEDAPLLLRSDERTREALANGTALYCPNPGSQVSFVAGGNLSVLGGGNSWVTKNCGGIGDVRLLLGFSVVDGSGWSDGGMFEFGRFGFYGLLLLVREE